MNKNYSGKLELDENNQYIVNGENISAQLDHLYMNEIPATYSLLVSGKEKFNEEGVLYKKKNVGLVFDYTIAGVNLEDKLFRLVDKNIDFTINVGKVS